MNATLTKRTEIISNVFGWRQAQIIRTALFNECGGIDAYATPTAYRDTEAYYSIHTEQKLTKAQLLSAAAFAKGAAAMWRAVN